jgi:hypothetical protein
LLVPLEIRTGFLTDARTEIITASALTVIRMDARTQREPTHLTATDHQDTYRAIQTSDVHSF